MVVPADDFPLAGHTRIEDGNPEQFSQFRFIFSGWVFPLIFQNRYSVDLLAFHQSF